jgi:hypothetical protein
MLFCYMHLQRFFKLALEEVQELLDARSNKPTVTQHFPVDFTRPETYEHLLREVTSEELDEQQDAAAAMQYPDEATAADAQQASSGAVLLEWLQRAAAMPGAACEVGDRLKGSGMGAQCLCDIKHAVKQACALAVHCCMLCKLAGVYSIQFHRMVAACCNTPSILVHVM